MTARAIMWRAGGVRRAITTLSLSVFVSLFGNSLAPVLAQERTGHIHGRVVDSTGGVIVGAQVTVIDALTGYKREVTSNADGNYSAPRLQTGNYTVEVQSTGFRSVKQSGVVIGAGEISEINFTLEVGAATDQVEVSGIAPMVNTSSGAVRTSIDQVFVERVPLNGRNANDLIALVPGITTGVKGSYAANGVRETSNNFTLDGTDNSDVWQSTGSRNPPPDALQEFTVQSNYSAEYGRGGGAAIHALTKSGTNSFHGSVYDYFRSDNLNANTFERNARGIPKPDFKQHQWGGTIGGPIAIPGVYDGHNKSFFFFNMQRLGTPAAPYLVRRGGLTAAELAGDFSQSAEIPVISESAAEAPNSPFAGMAGQPLTDLTPYISRTAQDWYRKFNFPIVNESGDFTFEDHAVKQHQPDYTLRADHSITDKNRLSFSMFYRLDAPDPQYRNNAPSGFQQGRRLSSHHYSTSDVWTLSSTMVNEVAFGYSRIWDTQVAEFGDVPFNSLGFPFAQISDKQFLSIKPDLSPSEFNLEAPSFKYEAREVYDIRDTVTWLKGRHFMKFGGMIQIHQLNQELSANHEYQYEGQWLGNRAAEFLIGWPRSFGSIEAPSLRSARRDFSHAFFQDDWKVTPALTVNLGVRWEPHRWGYLNNDSALIFIPGARSQYTNFPLGTIMVTEPPSPSRSGRENDLNNFAPRLGAAYRLDNDGRRVIRGGWGVFYDTVSGVHDGIDLHSDAFRDSYGTDFDRGYPGPEGWLDIFAYQGIPTPDLSNLSENMNPSERTFNPLDAPGIYQPKLELGYVQQYNATYEQEFRPGWTYSIGYVGSRGTNLWGLDFWNMPVRRDATDNWDDENMASRRPDQTYRYVDKQFVANNGRSLYNAAQFTFKANTSAFHLLSHYTYSRAYSNIDGTHSEGDAQGYGRSDPMNLDADWSRSVMDIPHRLLVASTWDLPFARGRKDVVGALFGNWGLTSVVRIESGRLVNVLAAQNNSYTCQQCWVRPDATGEPMINDDWRSDPDLVYVNENAFRQPADGTVGNLPKNAIRWPYTKNVDMSIRKELALAGSSRFEFRLDIFNLFNWVNFRAPARVRPGADSSTMSMWKRGMMAPRTMQVAGRILF